MLQICMHFHFKRCAELSLLLKSVSQLPSMKASESSKISIETLKNIWERKRGRKSKKEAPEFGHGVPCLEVLHSLRERSTERLERMKSRTTSVLVFQRPNSPNSPCSAWKPSTYHDPDPTTPLDSFPIITRAFCQEISKPLTRCSVMSSTRARAFPWERSKDLGVILKQQHKGNQDGGGSTNWSGI